MSGEGMGWSEGIDAPGLADVPARLEFNSGFLGLLVAEFDEKDWIRAPAEGLSNSLWILGHLAWSRMRLLRSLGAELPDEPWESAFSIGSHPSESPSIDAGELQEIFPRLGRLIAGRLESMVEEELASPLEKPMPDGARTVAGLVRFMCFHESYHIGQLGLMRRLCGKPGLA